MIVADASAVVDLLLGMGSAPAVRDVMSQHGELHAPELLDLEVLSAFRRLRRAIEKPILDRAVTELGDLRVQYHAHALLREAVWSLRDRCSAYDASYVAVAQRTGFPLVTADQRLVRAVEDLIEVVDLS